VQDLKEHLFPLRPGVHPVRAHRLRGGWAGCGVVLLNPSRYHRELSRAAGFPEIGLASPDRAALRRFLRSPAAVFAMLAGIVPREVESLADCLAGLSPAGSRECPACGSSGRRAQYRDPAKSYFRCAACGTVYMLRFAPGREHPYTEAYFFDEYRRQYGKTYLEDWPALTALAEPRLEIIEDLARMSLGRAKGLSILDVGCAYGPFLAAAKARGQDAFGLDASEEAASYVRRELDLPAAAGDFLDPSAAGLRRAFRRPLHVVRDRALRAPRQGASERRRPREAGRDTRPLHALPRGSLGPLRPPRLLRAEPRGSLHGVGAFQGQGYSQGLRLSGRTYPDHGPSSRAAARPALPRVEGSAESDRQGLLAWAGRIVSGLFGLGDTFEIYAVREEAREAAKPRRRSSEGYPHHPARTWKPCWVPGAALTNRN
jgi:hypothetical protein